VLWLGYLTYRQIRGQSEEGGLIVQSLLGDQSVRLTASRPAYVVLAGDGQPRLSCRARDGARALVEISLVEAMGEDEARARLQPGVALPTSGMLAGYYSVRRATWRKLRPEGVTLGPYRRFRLRRGDERHEFTLDVL